MVLTEALTLTKLVAAGKAALDYLKERAKDAEDAAKLAELHDVFQSLREENTRLLAALHQRDEELRERDNAARRDYDHKAIGKAVVRVRTRADGTHGPACCPQCNDRDGVPLPLQGRVRMSLDDEYGTHRCMSCKELFILDDDDF